MKILLSAEIFVFLSTSYMIDISRKTMQLKTFQCIKSIYMLTE